MMSTGELREMPSNGIADGEPRGNPPTDFRLAKALRSAILAPSSHNSQPWYFCLAPDHIDVFADRSRALPVVDPHDRELTISCGAALGTLEVALLAMGIEPVVEELPVARVDDWLARVRIGLPFRPADHDLSLADAIPRRRTTRVPFDEDPLPESLLAACVAAAETAGLELVVVTDFERRREVASLVAEGDRRQFSDPRFRRELAAWIHSRRLASRDGMSGASMGLPDLLSPVGALVVRTFDLGKGVAAEDHRIAQGSPALALLGSPRDVPLDWLRTGRVLSRLLLELTAAGVSSSYLNQPIEVDDLRPDLRRVAGLRGVPQLLLRLGYGPTTPPSVRRPLSDVVIHPPRVRDTN